MREFVTYIHHGVEVVVNKVQKGMHRQFCMCYECARFDTEDRDNGCEIANAVYDNCVKFNIVTPVWECPKFLERLADDPDSPEDPDVDCSSEQG